MNIKPTPEQVDDWELEAAKYAESQTSEYYEYQQAKNEKFAELAAQWGAAQAQQTTEPEAWNQAQVCTWIGNQLMTHPSMFERSEVCKFVRGLGRNAVLRSMFPKPQAQQTKVEGPELPEAVAYAQYEDHPTEAVGDVVYYHPNNAPKSANPLYTANQMHAFADAKVRAGAAGSQDAKRLTLEQLQYIQSALRAIKSYGNIFRYERHQVSPYEKIVDALSIVDAAMQGDKQ